MPRVLFRPAAVSDLQQIAEYIETDRPGRGDLIRGRDSVCLRRLDCAAVSPERPFTGLCAEQKNQKTRKNWTSFVSSRLASQLRPSRPGSLGWPL